MNRSQTSHLSTAAKVILAGVILSGPVAVGLVELLAPQPAWKDAATFIEHYSWIQSLPYVFGFLIGGGFILFMSSLVAASDDIRRPTALTALSLTAIAASLIFFNYVLQTAFVPVWLHSEFAVSMVTMANPNSLGWTLEMYGYGILGVATAFAAPLFKDTPRQNLIGRLFVVNCVVSLLGAVLVPLVPGWVLAPSGMILGALWNLLVAFIMVLVILEFKVPRE